MNVVQLLLPGLVAAALSFALTPVARWIAIRAGAVDRPDPRKVHVGEIPRLGGLAVVVSTAIVTGILWSLGEMRVVRIADDLALGLSLGLLPILAISIVDDIRPLPALPKYLVQLAGASVAVSLGIRLGADVNVFGQQVHLGWLAIPISLLWITGVTNAFNIVDGLDGLSAGLALISAGTLAGVSLLVGRPGLAALAIILAGALAGFLPYNLHPAKIFLGDTGSTAIGFCLACLALRGGSTLSSGLAILAPILVLGLPIAETLVSMARRFVRRLTRGDGSGVFEADREHFHHRLLKLGLDQRRAVMLLYAVGIAFASLGFLSLFLSYRKAAVLLATMVIAAIVALSRLGYEEFAMLRRGDMLRVYEVPVLKHSLFIVFVDLAAVALSIYFAVVLKYDDWALRDTRTGALQLLALAPAIALAMFSAFGLYRRAWRLATTEDLARASFASVATAVTTAAAANFLWNETPPLTFFALQGIVLLVIVDGVRASYRIFRDWRDRATAETGEPIVIYGAGQAGAMVIREILSNPDRRMNPIGFIDDDADKRGKMLAGYPVFGGASALEELIGSDSVSGVVVASYKIPIDRVREVAALCERTGVWLKHFRIDFESDEWLRENRKDGRPVGYERARVAEHSSN